MTRHIRLFCTALLGLWLTASPAHADEEAPNTPRVFTDDWGSCYAKTVPEGYDGMKGVTRVYMVQENDDKLVATLDWYSQRVEMICNACHDGTCAPVLVRHGPWSRGHEPSEQDLALAFYHGEKLMKRYSTLDIAGSKDNVSMSVSHYTVIEEHKGFTRTQDGHIRYVATTHDGRELTFDAVTGEQIMLKKNTKAELSLFKAVTAKDKAAINAALKDGANINTTFADEYSYDFSLTPLHFAMKTRDHALIKYLLDKGADIAARTHRGETALSTAMQSGDMQMLEFLLDNGADPNTKAPYAGDTMLHKAATSYNGLEMAKILKKHGADIEAKNEYGRTPMHAAAFSYQGTGMLKWLIENDGNVEAVSNFGEVPLHLAARYGSAEHVQILLNAGVHPAKRDNDKKFPLDYAKARADKKPGIVKLLENAALK